ncbi:hypothetical protein BD779DRAFT_1693568 [Infundibulicybe gibba]|nr:hypothetical protein BD779DRAFT_1693568 [Infundibulicybe gibba]
MRWSLHRTDEVQKDTAASSTLVAGPTDTTSATVPMKSFPIRAVIGGIIGGVAALGVIVFALFFFRRRSQRRTAYSNLGSRPLSDSSPYNSMSRPSQLEAKRTELEEPLSEKRQTMVYLPAAYASSFTLSTPSNATVSDDSDLKTQVQALREQMKRMESLQRGNVSQTYLGTSQSTLHNHGVASNTGAGPSAHQRSMSMMKREQTLVVANATQQGELLVHTDSGIRLIAEASVIELPPTYEAV